MKMWWCLSIAMIGLLSCGRDETNAPLDQPDRGIAALRWGDDGETVAARMLEMEGVYQVIDTILTQYHAAWVSADTVILPVHLRHFRWMMFRGGRWFGYPVTWWEINVHQGTNLRSVEIHLDSIEKVHPAARGFRRQLSRLYGEPEMVGMQTERHYGDGWTRPASDRSTASWLIKFSQRGKRVQFDIQDCQWVDSLSRYAKANPPRRVHVSEWETIKKQLKDEKGIVID